MKTIYIVLTKSTTILSKIVHFITSDTYTHAAISFDDNLKTLYSSSRKNGRTLFPAGPCKENLCGEYYSKHKYIPCAVYELRVEDEIFESAKYEVEKIIAQADKYKFNIIGLLLCQMNIPYHRKNYFFCSQFVSEILKRSNAMNLPKDTSLMRPSDYMKLPELLCCFRGYISELVLQKQLVYA